MKTIRFGDLVRDSGRPKTVALWTKPENDPALARAIKENRVLTVLQAHGKKDHGQIGFELLPGALYLEFPRTLPDAKDATVVGIDYQLIDEPEVQKIGLNLLSRDLFTQSLRALYRTSRNQSPWSRSRSR